MSLFGKLKMASKVLTAKNYSLSDFDKAFEQFFYGGKTTKSGISVNEETALKFSAFYACMRVITETFASMPMKVYKRRRNGIGRDLATDHPLHYLLHNAPSKEQTAFDFKETMQLHTLTSGNSYAYKEMNRRGEVTSLKLLNWHAITPKRDKETGEIYYLYQINGDKQVFSFDEIFHVHGLGFDGLQGYSPVSMMQEAIGLAGAAESFASYFYSNGANVGGFIEMPGTVRDKKAIKNEFQEKWGGLGNSHKVLFLEEGMKFQKLVMPLQDAQFIETRKFQIQEIARIYRVPLHLIQDLERATFSNIEHQDLGFIKHTMFPWISRWEQTINLRLLTPSEIKQGYFVETNMDAMLRGDAKSRAEVLHIKRNDGIINANEWRAKDNENPIDGDVGDAYMINGNMIPTELAIKGGVNGEKQVLEDNKQE